VFAASAVECASVFGEPIVPGAMLVRIAAELRRLIGERNERRRRSSARSSSDA
jgi:hypothetical protein